MNVEQLFRETVDWVSGEVFAAVDRWRAAGRADKDLALVILGGASGKPSVTTGARAGIRQIIPQEHTAEFDMTREGYAPAWVDLGTGLGQRIVWMKLHRPSPKGDPQAS